MTLKAKLRNQADKLFKQIIISRYNYVCELCGGQWRLTAHHFFYRSSAGHLRYCLDNGICLCAKCHARLHFKDPKLVEAEIIENRGQKWYKSLLKKAREKPKPSYQTIDYYRKQIELLK